MPDMNDRPWWLLPLRRKIFDIDPNIRVEPCSEGTRIILANGSQLRALEQALQGGS